MFQSLSGFQAACDPRHNGLDRAIPISFNPYRVFKPLATLDLQSDFHGDQCFNPYRVFKPLATRLPHIPSAAPLRFQSLSGFQAACDVVWGPGLAPIHARFQSLSGFQAACDCLPSYPLHASAFVSIPIGFSSRLRHRKYLNSSLIEFDVSIPIGFSSRLRPTEIRQSSGGLLSFQSLSGFQAACDRTLTLTPTTIPPRFNPYRVFKPLATLWKSTKLRATVQGFNPYRVFKPLATPEDFRSVLFKFFVSIPIGFSSRLRQRRRKRSRGPMESFNPYRVFKPLATARRKMSLFRWHSFNPYRVFKPLATLSWQLYTSKAFP